MPLWLGGCCFAARYPKTNGFIPVQALQALYPGIKGRTAVRLAVRLVEVGLWEKREDGWQIHDWDHYIDPSLDRMNAVHSPEFGPMNAVHSPNGHLVPAGSLADKATGTPVKSATCDSAGASGERDETQMLGCVSVVPVSRVLSPKTKRQTRNKKHTHVTDERFEAFWKLYPRKDAKQDAVVAWTALQPDDALVAKLMAALREQLTWPDRIKENYRYFPHACRWLKKSRWDDERRTPAVTDRRGIQDVWKGKTEGREVKF